MTLSFSGQVVFALCIFRDLVSRLFEIRVALAGTIFIKLVPVELKVEVPKDRAVCATNINGFLRFLHLVHLLFWVEREKEGLWVFDPPSFEIRRGPWVHGEAAEDMPYLRLHQG